MHGETELHKICCKRCWGGQHNQKHLPSQCGAMAVSQGILLLSCTSAAPSGQTLRSSLAAMTLTKLQAFLSGTQGLPSIKPCTPQLSLACFLRSSYLMQSLLQVLLKVLHLCLCLFYCSFLRVQVCDELLILLRQITTFRPVRYVH